MKIPVVLNTVHVDVGDDGHLLVDVDGEPRDVDRTLTRADLRSVLDQITTELGTPVRVEIRKADGTIYADIATPPVASDDPPPDDEATTTPRPGLHGEGFRPGEEVAVAYVLCTETAGADGRAAVQLPPALLAQRGPRMVLVGLTSAAVAEIEQPA